MRCAPFFLGGALFCAVGVLKFAGGAETERAYPDWVYVVVGVAELVTGMVLAFGHKRVASAAIAVCVSLVLVAGSLFTKSMHGESACGCLGPIKATGIGALGVAGLLLLMSGLCLYLSADFRDNTRPRVDLAVK